jgi:hypothetical protein
MSTVTTKYDLGQEVFFMHDNRVQSGIIGLIEIKTALCDGRPENRDMGAIEVRYGLLAGWSVPHSATFYEDRLFASKEDLLKSL